MADRRLVPDSRGQSFDETLYVDAATGSDDNPGTEDEPLETIQEAMDRTTGYKNDGRSVRVSIAPATYRETVEFAYSNFDGGGTNAHVLVEGAGPEKTVIKGSELFDNWSTEGDGIYTHDWTNNWGVAPDPTNGNYITDCGSHPDFCADRPDLVLRREMVFVDGERMRQVLSADALEPGTYFVVDDTEEVDGKLSLYPPTDVTLSDATVEVSVREKGWFTQSENNVTIRNLGIEQVATPWQFGLAAMVLDGNDITAENVRVVDNNFDGLAPRGDNLTLRNFTFSRNGGSGFGPFKVRNFLAEDGEVNANNWRGALGGYTGWSVGNKFFKGRNVTVRRTSFNYNQSKGLWLDTDLEDVLLEDLELRGNLRDNIWVERTQGPVTLRNVVSTGSGGYGLLLSNARDTTVEDSRLVDNQKGGIQISGDKGGVTFDDFENPETDISVKTRHIAVHDSVISGVNATVQGGTRGNFLIGTTFVDPWSEVIDTYDADNNVWYESEREDAFEWIDNKLITFEQWQDKTGADQNSVWAAPPDATFLERWRSEMSSSLQCASPAVDGETVYVGGLGSEFRARSRTQGAARERWVASRDGAFSDSAPVVDENAGLVFVGSGGGRLYAFDPSASQQRVAWTYAIDSAITSSPVVLDGTVYVGANDGTVHAVSTDGTPVWASPAEVGGPVYAGVAAASGRVFVTTSSGRVVALDADTGGEEWHVDTGTELGTRGPAVAGGTVYVGADRVYALAADTGDERWQDSSAYGGTAGSTPAVANGVVYVGSTDGHLYALNASNGAPDWRFQAGDAIAAPPAVANGRVVTASMAGRLYLLDETGTELASRRVGEPVRAKPVCVGSDVFVGTTNGRVSKFDTDG